MLVRGIVKDAILDGSTSVERDIGEPSAHCSAL